MPALPPSLVKRFLGVARDRLKRIKGQLGILRQGGSEEKIRELLREIHTIKGESRVMGFEALSEWIHSCEDIVLSQKEQGWILGERLYELLEKGLEEVEKGLNQGGKVEGDLEGFRKAVEQLLNEQEEEAFVENELDTQVFLEKREAKTESETGVQTEPLWKKSKATLEIEIETLNRLSFWVEEIQGLRGQHRYYFSQLMEISKTWRKLLQSMSRELERVMNQLGEGEGVEPKWILQEGWMTLLRTSIQLNHRMKRYLYQMENEHYKTQLHLTALEESLWGLRLLPLSSLFEQYRKSILRTAEQMGKAVKVVTEGMEVEVDQHVLEEIGEPLMHLVINALDHGIESPEERIKAGKSREGQILLGAWYRGTGVDIVVEDDGRGLDLEKIRRIGEAQGELGVGASEEEVQALIFKPGWSSKQRVTTYSGRGMGLDVVKTRIEALGGQIQSQTRPGRGMRFELHIPISVAMINILHFQVSEGNYGIGSEVIETVQWFSMEEIHRMGRGHYFEYDGKRVMLYDMSLILGSEEGVQSSDGALVLILREHFSTGVQFWGFQIDAFVGEVQIIQHGWDPFLGKLDFLQGSAVLPSGSLVILLNAPALLRRAQEMEMGQLGGDRVAKVNREAGGHVLIVDDSEITRQLLSGFLEKEGWKVSQAIDGRDALHKIEALKPDLVMTDLDMPMMDGYALLEAVKGKYPELPMVVMSSQMSDQGRQKALDLGARHYLIKSQFERDRLVKVLRSILDQSMFLPS